MIYVRRGGERGLRGVIIENNKEEGRCEVGGVGGRCGRGEGDEEGLVTVPVQSYTKGHH